MVAAQQAAKTPVQELPHHIEVGLVTFAGSTQVAQQATLDRNALVAAIDAIQMQIPPAWTRCRPRSWRPSAGCASTA